MVVTYIALPKEEDINYGTTIVCITTHYGCEQGVMPQVGG